ncbi:MAG: radical SAM protein [Candidatus Omnitrophica bacterium]|nr:radical SAM protein [Candidatus Omnitrophota bacterium]
MGGCGNMPFRFEFTPQDISQAVSQAQLLSIEIEFSLKCNLRCPYCYISTAPDPKNELTSAEIRDVILQARDLGARKIIILGGEPLIYPRIMEKIEFIREQGLQVELFTNGAHLTQARARRLFDLGVNVVLKMNSFKDDIQDKLVGVPGTSKKMRAALAHLREAGYPRGDGFLAVSTVICQDNLPELTALWIWLRDQGILPYFEILTPQGGAAKNDGLNVSTGELEKFFHEISEIDRTRYNQVWEPQPPLVGGKCLRHQFSCLINSQGFVMPCVGLNVPIGNIREKKLKDILSESEIVQDLRQFHHKIKGPCGKCEKAGDCYGCRGAAYQLTGDYLASDPLCWNNEAHAHEIVKLPVEVNGFVLHDDAMLLVDKLIKIGERTAEVETTVRADMPFVSGDGFLDEAAYLEIIAQAAAAMGGFRQYGTSSKKPMGFLLGTKQLEVFGRARVGDVLSVSVSKYAQFGDFGMVKGSVTCGSHLLAQGEIKTWHNKAPQESI